MAFFLAPAADATFGDQNSDAGGALYVSLLDGGGFFQIEVHLLSARLSPSRPRH